MNRVELQQLAEDRILDAQALLVAHRWSGAYYLAGYAVECGLKSCVLAYVIDSGVIFQDKKYAEKCWTHNLEDLVTLAGLEEAKGIDIARNPALAANWVTVSVWSEASRYQQKDQPTAQKLYDAVADNVNGVLQWLKKRW